LNAAPRDACALAGEERTAWLRGEGSPEEREAIRAHVAGCPSCAAAIADEQRIRAGAASRTVPPAPPGARARLAAALDRACAEADAADAAAASRGPVARLVVAAGRRYATSRGFRFLTISVAAHAAAALVLAVHVAFGPAGGAPPETFVTVSSGTLPPPYDEDPLRPSEPPRLPGEGAHPGLPETAYVDAVAAAAALDARPLPPVPEDPLEAPGMLRLYPSEAMRLHATGRFRAAERSRRMERAWGPEEGPRAALAVEKGLRWLDRARDPDGTWASGRPGDPAAVRDRFRGGNTGMVLLAFLGDGRTARREGPFAGTVRNGIAALLRSEDPATGLLGGFGPRARTAADDRPLCNHAPALEALAEAYGLDYGLWPAATRDELAGAVGRALGATLRAQLPDGSFGYAPGARQGDASVTLLQVEALAAARRAGFAVDPAAFRRAGAWLRQRLDAGGRLGYRVAGDRAADATLTAGALPFADLLGFTEEERERMAAAVLAEAGPAAGRVLFRSALLEVLGAAASADPDRGAAAARAAREPQGPAGQVPAAGDRYAAAAGDVLATARTVRGLTAPLRTPR
jgi:hypothetical protein